VILLLFARICVIYSITKRECTTGEEGVGYFRGRDLRAGFISPTAATVKSYFLLTCGIHVYGRLGAPYCLLRQGRRVFTDKPAARRNTSRVSCFLRLLYAVLRMEAV
jgi:hypothetical protein